MQDETTDPSLDGETGLLDVVLGLLLPDVDVAGTYARPLLAGETAGDHGQAAEADCVEDNSCVVERPAQDGEHDHEDEDVGAGHLTRTLRHVGSWSVMDGERDEQGRVRAARDGDDGKGGIAMDVPACVRLNTSLGGAPEHPLPSRTYAAGDLLDSKFNAYPGKSGKNIRNSKSGQSQSQAVNHL